MPDLSARPARPVNEHSVANVFVFFLIGLFAVLTVLLTLISIRAYRSVSLASVRNSEGQIALSYLMNKVHSADAAGDVELQELDGKTVLCLRETIEGEAYETRIYFMDGALREYFCERGEAFDAEMGESLCDLAALTMEMETPWLVKVKAVQPNGETQSLHIALRAREARP